MPMGPPLYSPAPKSGCRWPAAPMRATYAAELEDGGSAEMSRFHMLSDGNSGQPPTVFTPPCALAHAIGRGATKQRISRGSMLGGRHHIHLARGGAEWHGWADCILVILVMLSPTHTGACSPLVWRLLFAGSRQAPFRIDPFRLRC